MNRAMPLWQRMYYDECYTEVVRAVGFAGCRYRELEEKLKPLVKKFGGARVEAAAYDLLTYEGQATRRPAPLEQVRLRDEARKLASGLLGLPPEHPWHDAYRRGERIPLPWEKDDAAPKAKGKPMRKRGKKTE